jgi:hypothetical protein
MAVDITGTLILCKFQPLPIATYALHIFTYCCISVYKFHTKVIFSTVSRHFTVLTADLGPKLTAIITGYKYVVSFLMFHYYCSIQLHCPHFTDTFDFVMYSYWLGYSVVHGKIWIYPFRKSFTQNRNILEQGTRSKQGDPDKKICTTFVRQSDIEKYSETNFVHWYRVTEPNTAICI